MWCSWRPLSLRGSGGADASLGPFDAATGGVLGELEAGGTLGGFKTGPGGALGASDGLSDVGGALELRTISFARGLLRRTLPIYRLSHGVST
jgi:hypothetical protein